MRTSLQQLPSSGPAREVLREKGQFWTPPWLAQVMARWVTKENPTVIFDPAVGPGTFFAAARAVGHTGIFKGFELHPSVFDEGAQLGLKKRDFARIRIADFINSEVTESFPAIISNPPYIRHHRLSEWQKQELKTLAKRLLGFPLDGRVGLHLYFLLKCLDHLAPEGRLAFLLPADVCEGVSSSVVWNRICEKYRLEAVLTFSNEAAPFPQVDTNAMVFLISRKPPQDTFKWLRTLKRDSHAILQALDTAEYEHVVTASVILHRRQLVEALKTGLSRPPRSDALQCYPLSNFAKVIRGIATGANEFFFLTRKQIHEFGLDQRFFLRAVGRTRDCPSGILAERALEELDAEGRPTWLLNLGNDSIDTLPKRLRTYLERGEGEGFPERALIKSRRPWYKMERRTPPPILFAYLGRRDCRFILNEAGVVPLTSFLCVYPLNTTQQAAKRLWRALNHPDTLRNLLFVGKSYGKGALKVEPRQLDALEIPLSVLEEVGLTPPATVSQLMLLEEPAQYNSKRRTAEPVGKLKVIKDFLPPPKDLVSRKRNIKIASGLRKKGPKRRLKS